MTEYPSPALSKEAYTKIIDTAIRKAVANGWERGQQLIDNGWEYEDRFAMPGDEPDVAIADPFIILDGWSEDYVSIRDIIFAHDFAKALWPGTISTSNKGGNIPVNFYAWQYHLQNMVVAKDALQYLDKNI